MSVFFFFQAEDGIRDLYVTGVQTCALPIWPRVMPLAVFTNSTRNAAGVCYSRWAEQQPRCSSSCARSISMRSEERRVGKECRSRWWRAQEKKKEKDG